MKVLICGPEPSLEGGVAVWMKMVLSYFTAHPQPFLQVDHLPVKRSLPFTHLLPRFRKLYYDVADYVQISRALRRRLRNESYDLVHVVSSAGHGIVRDWLFVKLIKRYRAAAVVHYHCGTIPHHLQTAGVLRWFLTRVFRLSDQIVVLDEATRLAVVQAGCETVVKIGNPYNPMIDTLVSDASKRLPATLLFVGHVVPEKGIRELLQAVRELPQVRLQCFGPEDRQFHTELIRYVTEHDLQDRVTFYGLRPSIDIFTEMCRATLFVLPTYTEGFPFVIVEAMACGCPILSSPVGAIEEMLTSEGEVQGLLVAPRDPEGLRSAIEQCLAHPEVATACALRAQQKARENYSLEAVMGQLVTMWNSIK